MKTKEWIITMFWVVLVVFLFSVNFITNKYISNVNSVYEVYLEGDIIGYIANDDELYNLINKKQQEIKDKYNIKNVYPPESFKIVKTNSYDVQISSVNSIYNKIASLNTFTIEGYVVSFKTDDAVKTVNILDKDIFEKAINNFVLTFVNTDDYNNYINNTQPQIETTGKIIEMMYFDETITIKKALISVGDTIYQDEDELTKYLLFGDNYEIKNYVVKSGDTIQSISDANKLNPQEFLIANPKYSNVDSLLTIGDSVNITLINPVITFSYEVNEVSDSEIPFETKIEYDNSKDSSFSEITTPGTKGITRSTIKTIVKNGETQSGAYIVSSENLVEKVDQVITKGRAGYSGPITGRYVDDGSEWGWPTNRPYVITSEYGYRWGTLHNGMDISGTGYGSPIYASKAGTVYYAGWEGPGGSGCGYGVLLAHENNYYSLYCHMSSTAVSADQSVSRGQIIGYMGASGYALGTHLHITITKGIPFKAGSQFYNPRQVLGV